LPINCTSTARAKIRVVPNGFDEADFAGLRGAAPPEARFTIVHAGSCQPPYRDPRGFLQALRRCVERGHLPSDTRVVFLGAGDALRGVLADSLSPSQLQGRVQLIGRVPHRQAIASMLEASVLLLLQDWEPHRTSVPQKAYEYLRSGRLILAIAPPSSDTAALVAKHPGVFLAAPTDLDEMVAQLVAAYRTWCADPHRTFARAVSEYDRRRLASAMLAVIDEVRRDRSRAACP
jgi:glycosyltransferase involved in cell wall biosynthesis